MRTFRDLLTHRLHNGWMIVTEEQRTVTTEIIDVLVSIDVPFARPLRLRDEERIGCKVARVVRHAAREESTGTLRKSSRSWCFRSVCAPDSGFRNFHAMTSSTAGKEQTKVRCTCHFTELQRRSDTPTSTGCSARRSRN